jgi:low temperature requirement protein LtrA
VAARHDGDDGPVATESRTALSAIRSARRRPDGSEWRASWFELFFDLVFVLVVSQLSTLLVADLTPAGAARALFLLLVAWWAWIHTTWTTNWLDPDSVPMRIVLLVGMFASMLGAISIPDAFGDRAALLVAGYVAIQLARSGFAVVATLPEDPIRPSLVRLLAWQCAGAVIWLAGVFVPEAPRVAVWVVALAVDYAAPLLGHPTPGLGRSDPREWELEPSHFSERLMLFLIIALGEVIVAAGAAAAKLPLDAPRVLAFVVSFGVAVVLWWLYFDFHADRTLRELRAAAGERGRLARDLSYLFVPLVAGIILCAVADEIVIAHPGDPPGTAQLVALGAGPVVYLLGSVAFKVRVIGRLWELRAIGAATVAVITGVGAALATIPAVALWAAVFVVLGALALAEVPVTRRERGGG